MRWHIHNPTAIDKYLRGFADGDKQLASLLIYALSGPIKNLHAVFDEIQTPDNRWSEKLSQQFEDRTARWLMFKPNDALQQHIITVRDWLSGQVYQDAAWLSDTDMGGKPRKLADIQTFYRALEIAQEEHTLSDKQMKAEQEKWGGSDELAEGNLAVEMKLENGYRIVKLCTVEALERESAFMGHCIGDPERSMTYIDRVKDGDLNWAYYSLRDSRNKPHATFEVNVLEKCLYQCKGKENDPPVEKYFPYVQDFIKARDFDLTENAGHTGLLRTGNEYWDIFNLPEGFKLMSEYHVIDSKRSPAIPQSVAGSLDLRRSNITDLGQLQKVGGYLNLRGTAVVDLGQLQLVGGSLDLRDTPITDLGQLRAVVDGDLYLQGTPLTDFGSLESVSMGCIYTDIGTFETLEGARDAFAKHFGVTEHSIPSEALSLSPSF